jgi:hypothetical protein
MASIEDYNAKLDVISAIPESETKSPNAEKTVPKNGDSNIISTSATMFGNFKIAKGWRLGPLISIFRKRPTATCNSAWKQQRHHLRP